MPRYDSDDSNRNSTDFLYVAPEELSRDGQYIHEPADMIESLVAWYKTEREALGTPWGEGDEFAEQIGKVMEPLEENLMLYLDAVALAVRQTSDGTLTTARNNKITDEHNIEQVNNLNNDTPDSAGGRR
ncbi:hypothetical protein [Nocardiopsis trehalosi]|jgi:hypothetical protein|uniref:hypothetical protein n=1 Tax=Nocardiopsis trehalosi TaxID=109329 RepID=UPI0008312A4D|nr:hypothetical protein [Nocardiopsis trehalosi]